MAIFDNDRNSEWKSYQEEQIDILNSIESLLGDIKRSDQRIFHNLYNLPSIIYNATSLIIESIDAIWNDKNLPEFPKDDISTFSEDFLENIEESKKDMDVENLSSEYFSVDSYGDIFDTDDIEDPKDEIEEEVVESNFRLKEALDTLKDVIKDIDLSRYMDKMARQMDSYSELMNETIKLTGASQDEAQSFRRDIVTVVNDLNEDVGNKFNPQEVLDTMLRISSSTNISNRRTLDQIAAPILLAQETMNININSLAEESAKLYNRLGFTAGDLEDMVGHIRGLSEGNDVSEDAILQSMADLEDAIRIRALEEGNNNEFVKDFMMSVGNARAYGDSMYIDNMETYMEDMKKFLSTDEREQAEAKRKYSNFEQILESLESGDAAKALEIMLKNIASYDITVAGARGFSTEEWRDVYTAVNGENFKTSEEFMANYDSSTSPRDSVEEQYVSVTDQINNKMSSVVSYLSTIQENLGIGVADIASALYIWQRSKEILGDVFTRHGLSMTRGAAGAGTLAGVLGKVGTALGVAGAAVGVALIAKNIYDIMEEQNQEGGEIYQEGLTSTSEGAPYGYGLYDKRNSETGEVEWAYKPHESEEAASKYKENEVYSLAQYSQDKYQELPWYEKLLDAVTTSFFPGKTSLYQEQIQSTYNNVQSLLNDPSYEALRNFYSSKGLLTSTEEIEHFANNIEKYQSYYEQGIYYDKEKDSWFTVDGDSRVLDKDAPESFAVGTNYIPGDQLAYLHEGEAVVPKEYNPAANFNELERLREESRNKEISSSEDIVESIENILQFLEEWKNSRDRKELVNKSNLLLDSSIKSGLARYTL